MVSVRGGLSVPILFQAWQRVRVVIYRSFSIQALLKLHLRTAVSIYHLHSAEISLSQAFTAFPAFLVSIGYALVKHRRGDGISEKDRKRRHKLSIATTPFSTPIGAKPQDMQLHYRVAGYGCGVRVLFSS